MGFPAEVARAALDRANGNAEDAATELLAGPPVGHSADPQHVPPVDTFATPVRQPAEPVRLSQLEKNTGLLIDTSEMQKIEPLLGMGFTADQSIVALRDADGDTDKALE